MKMKPARSSAKSAPGNTVKNNKNISLLIADDHSVVRKGLKQIFSEEPDMDVVGEASTAFEVIAFLKEHRCDVLVLDINMPNKSGIDIIKDIKNDYPRTAILVLSMYAEDQFGFRALRNGASGYLRKDAESDEMIKAIRRVASGRKYINEKLAEVLEHEVFHDANRPPHASLTDREYEVFRSIVKGTPNKTIAKELFLSVKTVNNYRTRILTKMRMKSNAELFHYAHEHSLTD